MSKEKIKVLAIYSDLSGVGHYRTIWPLKNLEKLYGDEFRVEINGSNEVNWTDLNYIKEFQIIHYHRTMCNYEAMPELMKRLRGLGIKLIMDIDDYWSVSPTHPAYPMVKKDKLNEKILSNIKTADWVTTTTPIFADEMKKHNKNIFVLPNTIDPTMKQFKPKKIEREKVAVGWLGGSSHQADLEILHSMFQRLRVDPIMNKTQIVLCGWDKRGTHTDMHPQTGEKTTRDILPTETSWYNFEKIFTDDWRIIKDKQYYNYLMKFDQENPYPNEENLEYRRVWTKLLKKYATNYNLFDISLAPLAPNVFNYVKSQLKVIESGFHHKMLIAQDYGPYTLDLIHGKNGMLIQKRKNHKDWFKFVKRGIESKDMREDLGESLYETVKDKYHINTDSKNRREFYLSLL
jgi:hypothetical protein